MPSFMRFGSKAANGQPVWDGLTPIRWRRGTLADLEQIGMILQHRLERTLGDHSGLDEDMVGADVALDFDLGTCPIGDEDTDCRSGGAAASYPASGNEPIKWIARLKQCLILKSQTIKTNDVNGAQREIRAPSRRGPLVGCMTATMTSSRRDATTGRKCDSEA
jgi:hypothetical protein